ncbi:UNVERIFIED_CONTAM: hypothetical protein RMT77_015332 [Armadillidium vulgare]
MKAAGDCFLDPICPRPGFITHECTSDSDCKSNGESGYCRGTIYCDCKCRYD